MYLHKMRWAAVVLLLLCGVGVAGVFRAEDPAIDRQCSKLATTFFRLPSKTQLEEFSRSGLEEQYTLLICGNQAIHPPALQLARALALRGATAVTFLKDKLAQAQGDLTVRDIVAVFAEMRRNHTYDVAADEDLRRLIDRRVAAMKDPDWKRLVSQTATEIRSTYN